MSLTYLDCHTIDFETTDKDPKIAKPVEMALFGAQFKIETFINPECAIPPETSAIHQIANHDVEDAPTWDIVKGELRESVNKMAHKILVAHNAQYEQGIIGEGFDDVQWICTYKCALRVWPELPSYKNEAIRYHFNFDGCGRQHAQMAHSAMHDCRVTAEILYHILQNISVEEAIEISSKPAALTKIGFGKHFGKRWADIPGDYLYWLCKQVDMNPDVKYCASEELNRRRNATGRPN